MIQYDLPMVDYLALDALSGGVANRVITQSPLHALASKANWKPSTPSNIGEICHALLLEGNEDNIVLVDADDWRTKAAQEMRQAAYNEGKVPILKREMEPIRVMVNRAEMFVDQSEIAGIFDKGKPEVTLTWDENGVTCKARPDYLSEDFYLAVKTTNVIGGANPEYFIRRMLGPLGYGFSTVFYDRGLRANDIKVEHRILCIEQNRPHGCSLIALAPSKWALYSSQVDRAINIWQECEKTNIFPGYPSETYYAEAEPWEIDTEITDWPGVSI